MLFNTYKPWKFAFSEDSEDIEKVKENSWGIIGVPFDSTSSYGPGCRFGPTTVREASYSFEKYNITFNRDIDSIFYDFGNTNVVYGNCKKTLAILEETISELVKNNINPIVIGGEHSISTAPIKALTKKDIGKYNIEEMIIIHFDAHMDIIDEYQGEKCSHATVMKRIHDLNPKEIIEIGVRSASKEEKEFADSQDNVSIFTTEDVQKGKKLQIIKEKLESIKVDEPIYISIDIDVLDPLYVPEVGNPVPDGLSPSDIELFLEILTKKNIVGFDLVEVATAKLGDPTAITASKIIYDFLSLVG